MTKLGRHQKELFLYYNPSHSLFGGKEMIKWGQYRTFLEGELENIDENEGSLISI